MEEFGVFDGVFQEDGMPDFYVPIAARKLELELELELQN
jgi:hypothetical protein